MNNCSINYTDTACLDIIPLGYTKYSGNPIESLGINNTKTGNEVVNILSESIENIVNENNINARKAAANTDVASADATDLATALTLVNELKATVNSLQAKLRTAPLLSTT